MGTAQRFEVGKYYQFTGSPMILAKGESQFSKLGALPENAIPYDIEINCWMDRRVRKCTYTDPINQTSAAFEDIFIKLRNSQVPWTVPRTYACYLTAGMFVEVEVY